MIASEAVVEMAVVGPLMVVDLRMEVVEDLQVEGDLRVEVVEDLREVAAEVVVEVEAEVVVVVEVVVEAGLLLLLLGQSRAVLGHL